MREVETPKDTVSKNARTDLESLSKAELERLAVEAIREHQRLVESDQVVYKQWECAKADPGVPSELVTRLEEECLRRQEKTAAQQDALSHLIDLLGFIPKVPEGDATELNPELEGRDPWRSQPRE